ncbi:MULTISPECIES: outer membrane protein assembly factor BamE [Burkholderia]|uniref:outer membrane protein assembly factor BamE n=1 Tax=Burkholderia TaxID=32008 RepID=UPI0013B36A9A|nr:MULTISPECIES: outer membrane protein assembly factor BamE [Burkholderia]QTD94195.1 outer membrane protein assembly factor BamE [Burkholderia anthina]
MRIDTMHGAAIALLGGMLLAGCSAASQSAANGAPVFPDPGAAWVADGTIVNPRVLRQIVPGITENQVYLLIHEPHFSEGTFGVRAWNYLIRFRTGPGNAFVTCQYQVQFDERRLVRATYWRNPGCADYVTPGAPAVSTSPVELPAQ